MFVSHCSGQHTDGDSVQCAGSTQHAVGVTASFPLCPFVLDSVFSLKYFSFLRQSLAGGEGIMMLLFPSLHCPISLWMFSSLYCAPTSLFNSSPATILPTKIHLELSSAGKRPLDFTMPPIHNSKYSTYTVLARIYVPLEGKR